MRILPLFQLSSYPTCHLIRPLSSILSIPRSQARYYSHHRPPLPQSPRHTRSQKTKLPQLGQTHDRRGTRRHDLKPIPTGRSSPCHRYPPGRQLLGQPDQLPPLGRAAQLTYYETITPPPLKGLFAPLHRAAAIGTRNRPRYLDAEGKRGVHQPRRGHWNWLHADFTR